MSRRCRDVWVRRGRSGAVRIVLSPAMARQLVRDLPATPEEFASPAGTLFDQLYRVVGP